MSVAAGEQLRGARELKGLTVEDVAARLKVPPRYVRALEEGDLAGLPEPTFVRGYVKAYARVVGLDPEAMMAELAPVEVKAPKPLMNAGMAASAGSSRRSTARVPNFRGGSRRRYGLVFAVLGALAVAVLGVFLLLKPDTGTRGTTVATEVAVPGSASTPAASSAVAAADGTAVTVEIPLPGMPAASSAMPPAPGAPAVVPTTAPTTAPGTLPASTTAAAPVAPGVPAQVSAVPATDATVDDAPRRGLHIRFRGTSWVEVRDADNVVLHTSVQLAGGALTLDGKAPYTVTFNDASVADIWFNGSRHVDRSGTSRVNRMIIGQSAR